MSRLALSLLLLGSVVIPVQAAVGVRIVFGLTDQADTVWDGSVTARGATVAGIEPWRFEGADAINGSSWKASTHEVRLFGGRGLFGATQTIPIVANGVVVLLTGESESAELDIKTAQGNFSVRLRDIPFGTMTHALGNRVMIDRVPPATQITQDAEEQDYPAAAADSSGNVWLAYLEFTHNKDHNRIRANRREPIKDFKEFTAPVGGDQVLVRKMSGGVWGEPIEISAKGGDLYRPAIAVDGAGRVWVFWSQNEKGDFELFARPIEGGKAGKTVRLTTASGSDVFPAAATDNKGKVWVAWQGWRNGIAAIFTASQNGAAFAAPAKLSNSNANEWNPTIAADNSGRVSVAWDSYRNGNYDIYMRTAINGTWGAETAAVASSRYEAYPSAAYDGSGRLWVAYEEGGDRFGKDFGAYDTNGLALYQGRAIRVIGFSREGEAVRPAADLSSAVPGVANLKIDNPARQSDSDKWLSVDPTLAKTRDKARAARNMQAPRNTSPRLTVDASGRMWLAYRSNQPIWWNPIGTVWSEYVASFDGSKWVGPVFLTHTDNLLDNRPALVSTRAGELVVIGSADHRREFHRIQNFATPTGVNPNGAGDPYNNDLFANTITLAPAGSAPAAVATQKPSGSAPDAMDESERKMVSMFRSYRKGNMRIMRGEFHRHSDVSMDGGNDGSVLDQWRYALDPGAMDWIGCCDHDNGGGREYSWWTEQKLTDIFHNPPTFVPMFSYERSVAYPEGHRNVIFAQRGVRTLPRLPITKPEDAIHAPDTQMLYAYLKFFDGIVALHTSGTLMGTDWRDNDPYVEPVVEIYQGDRQNYEIPGGPRTNTEDDSIGGWRPKGFVNLALEMGYKLGFQASSDHVSTHMSYCNIYVTEPTRKGVLEGFKKRHVYAATDNILADVRSGQWMMGDAFSTATAPALQVKLTGTAPFAKVHIIKDNKYVYTSEPKKATVDFSWRDSDPSAGKASYYYVRGEQENGEIVWVSPMWITYTGK